MKIKIITTLFILFLGLTNVKSQISLQDSVSNLFIDFAHSRDEKTRIETSKKFSDGLKLALTKDFIRELPFDSLKKYKVMLESPDKLLRIFTWDIPLNDYSHMFYGFVQVYNRKAKKYEVYELRDKSATIKDPENSSLDAMKWFGAYYFNIIETKHKKKKYYTLLGWDGNNQSTNKKIIDVLTINEKGFPKFGEPIFSDEKGKIKKRIIFEYKAGVTMSLRYEEEKHGIIFDHLSPSDPNLEGVYSFYGPDFTYDMLEFKDGKWLYVKNIDARNPKDKMDKHFKSPK